MTGRLKNETAFTKRDAAAEFRPIKRLIGESEIVSGIVRISFFTVVQLSNGSVLSGCLKVANEQWKLAQKASETQDKKEGILPLFKRGSLHALVS